ncbi:MAG: shikimate dehydrogenase [Solirubrobacteraceae bacterium]|nr:shikimate dehydrogenase [Solirubrobacteraceae bacterium]
MFAALGVAYQLLPVPPDLFDETVRALGAAGFGGANVTLPHKEAALALADEPSERARAIGAANTLTFSDAGIAADNTDAPGLIAALPANPAGSTVVVLGAGGSARAAVWALVDAGAEVGVWNRTPERAAQLARELGATWLGEVSHADTLVNCTAVGLEDSSGPDLPDFKNFPVTPDDLDKFSCVVDLVYRPGGTDLERAARERGIRTVDGLEVLVEQGALSFETWTGRAPDREAMRTAARDFDAPETASNTH